MRLFEISAESPVEPLIATTIDDEFNTVQGKRLAAYIKKNCSQWNRERGGTVFYRGTKVPRDIEEYVAFLRAPRIDRRPRDSDMLSHATFNEALSAANSVANRSNSLFACSSAGVVSDTFANTRRQIWVLFPFDGYHYAFAEHTNDWTGRWGSDIVDTAYRSCEATGENMAEVENFFLSAPTGFENAPDEVREAADGVIEDILDSLVVDADLQRAGEHGDEVMVTGSRMLHIQVDFYHEFVASYL